MTERDIGTGEGGSRGASDAPESYPAQPQDLLSLLGRRVANQQLNSLMHLDGSLDADRLRSALRLTLDGQPVLGCRLVEDPRRPYWERRDDLGSTTACPVIRCEDLDAEVQHFVVTPTAPTRDPLVRVVV